ncbi:MAG: UDP-2,3-diacylglucosamine diphosphatase LpxI [Desulfobacterales bacterium]|jgi:DUF1009 family protein
MVNLAHPVFGIEIIMKIGLIAGSGQFPILFSKKAKSKGFDIYAIAFHNETDPNLKGQVDAIQWLHLGQLKRLIKFFHRHEVKQAVMMGAVRKTRMFKDVRPDLKAMAAVFGLENTHDDGILRSFARILEDEGIQVKASTFLLPELLAAEGCWTHRKPSRAETADIELGWKLAKAIGRLDIGQCIVVGGGSVLAVEAIDGTDATIRRGGRLGNGTAVVVKVCKPDQDKRFDVPAVGSQTIATMHESNARALAIEAGRAVVFDRQEMIALADSHDISIVALSK